MYVKQQNQYFPDLRTVIFFVSENINIWVRSCKNDGFRVIHFLNSLSCIRNLFRGPHTGKNSDQSFELKYCMLLESSHYTKILPNISVSTEAWRFVLNDKFLCPRQTGRRGYYIFFNPNLSLVTAKKIYKKTVEMYFYSSN